MNDGAQDSTITKVHDTPSRPRSVEPVQQDTSRVHRRPMYPSGGGRDSHVLSCRGPDVTVLLLATSCSIGLLVVTQAPAQASPAPRPFLQRIACEKSHGCAAAAAVVVCRPIFCKGFSAVPGHPQAASAVLALWVLSSFVQLCPAVLIGTYCETHTGLESAQMLASLMARLLIKKHDNAGKQPQGCVAVGRLRGSRGRTGN